MSMQGNISNTMTYEGKLTLKCKNGNKTYQVKNAGTQLLMNLIARALAKEDIRTNAPQFLGFNRLEEVDNVNEEGTTIKSSTLLRRQIPLTGIVYEGKVPKVEDEQTTIPKSSLKLTGTILPTDMMNVTAPGQMFELVLYGASDGNTNTQRLATIKDNALSSIYQAVCSGVEVIVEWEMIFQCAAKEENN